MKISFNVNPKKRTVQSASAPHAVFSEDVAEEGPTEDQLKHCKRLQDEGNMLASEGNYEPALRCWEQALQLTPNDAVLHEQKAQVLLECGRPWEAIQSAIMATQLNPGWADGFLTLAHAQRNYGEPRLAAESLSRVLELQPDHAEAAMELAEVQRIVAQLQHMDETHQQRGSMEGRRARVVEGDDG